MNKVAAARINDRKGGLAVDAIGGWRRRGKREVERGGSYEVPLYASMMLAA